MELTQMLSLVKHTVTRWEGCSFTVSHPIWYIILIFKINFGHFRMTIATAMSTDLEYTKGKFLLRCLQFAEQSRPRSINIKLGGKNKKMEIICASFCSVVTWRERKKSTVWHHSTLYSTPYQIKATLLELSPRGHLCCRKIKGHDKWVF